MSWFISKITTEIPISIERIYHPIKGNWLARFNYSSEDESRPIEIGDAISLKNDDINLMYTGIIRSKTKDNSITHLIITGQQIDKSSKLPKQTIQKSSLDIAKEMFKTNSAEYLKIAEELNINGISGNEVGLSSDLYTGDKSDQVTANLTALSSKYINFVSNHTSIQMINKLGIPIYQNSKGTIVLGDAPETLDLDSYRSESVSVGSNYIEITLTKLDGFYNNIKAIEYTENTTIIWL